MIRIRARVARLGVLLVCLTATVATLATPAVAADQPIVTDATLTNGQALTTWPGLPTFSEGGFSGLYPVAGEPGHYWSVSDRGPNGDTFTPPGQSVRRAFGAPAFTPRIYKVAVDGSTHEMTILSRILLHLGGGAVDPARASVGGNVSEITGFGNTPVNAAANVPVTDEVPATDTNSDGDVETSDGVLPFDPYGLDTEGIVAAADGTFWLVDEYRPSIIHVSADGTLLQRYTPKGQNAANLGAAWSAVPLKDILPAIYSNRRDNRGFEGVAISPDGNTLYAIMQNSISVTDGCTGGSFQSNNNRSAVRIAKVDVTDPANPTFIGDFFYTMQVNANGQTLTDLRISDLYFVGPDKLLVDERDDAAGGPNKWLYEVDLSGLTNLQTLPAATALCIDALKPPDVLARGVIAASVGAGTKVQRLQPGAATASPAYPFGKLEGITTIGSTNFATVNDNDFNLVFTGNGTTTPMVLTLGAPATPTRFLEYGPQLTALSDFHAWLGLKNSDDQGTSFDVKVELVKNGATVASGLQRCLTGVTRNPNLATEVVVPWDAFAPVAVRTGDQLEVRVSTRIGTNGVDTVKCAGHNNAVGLRVYYDAVSRQSRFDATIINPPVNPVWFLHSDGNPCANAESTGVTTRSLDAVAPSAAAAKCKDSAAVNFAGGNQYKVIGSWSLAPLP